MLLQPSRVARLRTFGDFADELHGLGFVAGLARVVRRDDHLDLNGHDVATASNQPRRFDSLARDSHRSPSIEEVDRHQLRDAGWPRQGPDGLEFRAIGPGLAYFDGWVGHRVRSLDDQDAVVQPCDREPLEDASLFKSLRRVLADDVLALAYEVADEVESLAHESCLGPVNRHPPPRFRIVTESAGARQRKRRSGRDRSFFATPRPPSRSAIPT